MVAVRAELKGVYNFGDPRNRGPAVNRVLQIKDLVLTLKSGLQKACPRGILCNGCHALILLIFNNTTGRLCLVDKDLLSAR